MLSTSLLWIYILGTAYLFGMGGMHLLAILFRKEIEAAPISTPLVLLVGLCLVNSLAALLSLFLRLGWLTQALFFLSNVVLVWWLWKKNALLPPLKMPSTSWMVITLFVVIFLTVLLLSSNYSSNPDTGIYHAQAIRWMETYPAVPGLGNLHSRFAYNSQWLVLNAFFSFSFLGLQSFHVLPGALTLVVIAWLLEGVNNLLQGKRTVGNTIKLLLIPLLFYTISSEISSPGTDFPTTLLTWVILPLWVDVLERKSQQAGTGMDELLVFLFSLYAVTVKLSAVPLLLIALVIFISRVRKSRIVFAKLCLLVLVILLPWCARNLVLSGYWVYPLPSVSFLSPDFEWKIPLQTVIAEKNSILAWGRIPRADMGHVFGMTPRQWLTEWFLNQTLNQQMLIVGALLSPLVFALGWWINHWGRNGGRVYLPPFLVAYTGLAFWLFGAPDIRFGYGFICITLLLVACPILLWVVEHIHTGMWILRALVSIILLYQGLLLFLCMDGKSLPNRLLLPENYNNLPTSPCSIADFTLHCADYYNECWYSPFPCIPPGEASENVELRGETLREGFRVRKDP